MLLHKLIAQWRNTGHCFDKMLHFGEVYERPDCYPINFPHTFKLTNNLDG